MKQQEYHVGFYASCAQWETDANKLSQDDWTIHSWHVTPNGETIVVLYARSAKD